MSSTLVRGAALGAVGSGLILAKSPTARSVAIRLLSKTRPDPARARGVRVSTDIARGAWTRVPLIGHLSGPLSTVSGRPVEAVVYGHFGGFGGRPYAAYLDPESPYYQAWVGAYAVFVNDGPPFGFDGAEKPVPEAAQHLLEADQRLVLHTAGLYPLDDPRPRVRAIAEPQVDTVIAWAASWVRVRGQGETVSSFERGSRSARERGRWLYGRAPTDSTAPLDDFHAVTAHASLWYRFDPVIGGTVAKFYVWVEYADRQGSPWRRGAELEQECETLVDGFRFDRVI